MPISKTTFDTKMKTRKFIRNNIDQLYNEMLDESM